MSFLATKCFLNRAATLGDMIPLSYLFSKTLQSLQQANSFSYDLPGFISSFVVTRDDLRPDLLLSISDEWCFILELTVCFESNLRTNAER